MDVYSQKATLGEEVVNGFMVHHFHILHLNLGTKFHPPKKQNHGTRGNKQEGPQCNR